MSLPSAISSKCMAPTKMKCSFPWISKLLTLTSSLRRIFVACWTRSNLTPSKASLISSSTITTRSAPGTATPPMYYGEELGMRTTVPTRKEDVKDPVGRTGWPKDKGRDGERTPMQWDSGKHAGFSTGASTWLPVAANYASVNVQSERQNADSLLNYYRE